MLLHMGILISSKYLWNPKCSSCIGLMSFTNVFFANAVLWWRAYYSELFYLANDNHLNEFIYIIFFFFLFSSFIILSFVMSYASAIYAVILTHFISVVLWEIANDTASWCCHYHSSLLVTAFSPTTMKHIVPISKCILPILHQTQPCTHTTSVLELHVFLTISIPQEF